MTSSAQGAEWEGAKEEQELMISPSVSGEKNSNVIFGTLFEGISIENIKKKP